MSDLSPVELASMTQGLNEQQKLLFTTQYNSHYFCCLTWFPWR